MTDRDEISRMDRWYCSITGWSQSFETIQAILDHQQQDHDDCNCRVCGETLPAGYHAIRHVFTEHGRAEYVRNYRADAGEIRRPEDLLNLIEDELDASGYFNEG